MTKRKIFLAALAICIVAILSMGTLAYFSYNDSVKNEFMIATSDDDEANEVFSVDVWEEQEEGSTDKEQSGYDYDDVVPGDNLPKIVHVENTGYYEQYVRVTVTVSDASAWKAMLGDNVALEDIVDGFDTTKVLYVNATEVNDTLVYELYYRDILEMGKDFIVFKSVKIPSSMDAEEAAAFNDGTDPSFYIDIVAKAIQTKNVGDDILEAFETVEGKAPAVNTAYVSSGEEMQAAINKGISNIKLSGNVNLNGGIVIS